MDAGKHHGLTRYLALFVLAVGLLLAACGGDEIDISAASPDPSDEVEQAEPSEEDEMDSSEPPPVQLTRGENTLALEAWTYCWTSPGADEGICADGAPPETPETLTGEGPIMVTFPHDFTFVATLYDADYANEQGEAIVSAVDGGWQVDVTADGPSVLELFGKGPEGDVIVTVALG